MTTFREMKRHVRTSVILSFESLRVENNDSIVMSRATVWGINVSS